MECFVFCSDCGMDCWVGVRGGRIICFGPDGEEKFRKGLGEDDCTSLTPSRDGTTVWVGTNNGRIYRWALQLFRMQEALIVQQLFCRFNSITHDMTLFAEIGEEDDIIQQLEEACKGTVLVVAMGKITSPRSISVLSMETGSVLSKFPVYPWPFSILGDDTVVYVKEDDRHNL